MNKTTERRENLAPSPSSFFAGEPSFGMKLAQAARSLAVIRTTRTVRTTEQRPSDGRVADGRQQEIMASTIPGRQFQFQQNKTRHAEKTRDTQRTKNKC